MTAAGRIFEARLPHARTMATNQSEVLTRVSSSLDTRGRLYTCQELVRVQLQRRARTLETQFPNHGLATR